MKYQKAYICSPLSAKNEADIRVNMLQAQKFMWLVKKIISCQTVAPHAYLPYILNDNIPEERKLGLSFGKSLLELCDCLVICTDTISNGMKAEIKLAKQNGIDILKCKNNQIAILSDSQVDNLLKGEL